MILVVAIASSFYLYPYLKRGLLLDNGQSTLIWLCQAKTSYKESDCHQRKFVESKQEPTKTDPR
jgi:hypothetical protein